MIVEYLVVINCCDCVMSFVKLVWWLEDYGYWCIVFVDNVLIYFLLFRYYDTTLYFVIWFGDNLGYFVLWESVVIDIYIGVDEYYVVIDCDVVFDFVCLGDVLSLLQWFLEEYLEYCKVGFGLRIDNLLFWYC